MAFACLFIGTLVFNKFLTQHEYWKLILYGSLISLIFAPFGFILIFRINLKWGIPDMALIIFTGSAAMIISQCFVFMPMNIVFTKICPRHIEATTYALLAGMSNFRLSIQDWMGAWINKKFVGVTQDDLSRYWVLAVITFACSFWPLFFLWLIPKRKQISDLQERMKQTVDSGNAEVD